MQGQVKKIALGKNIDMFEQIVSIHGVWSVECCKAIMNFEKNIHAFIHVLISTHTHTHIYIYIYIYLYVYTHTYIYIYIYIYIYLYLHNSLCPYIYVKTYIQTYVYIYSHTHT